MKCEVCLELLEGYFDGELAAEDYEQVGTHLITCANCSAAFASLTAEQKLFARYDREIEVPPFLWTRVAAHTVTENVSSVGWRARLAGFFATPSRSFAGAIAILLLAIAAGVVYLISRQPESKPAVATGDERPANPSKDEKQKQVISKPDQTKSEVVVHRSKPTPRVKTTGSAVTLDQSDVLSSDLSYLDLDLDERDTARHIEQTENLLRSIRNYPVADDDEEIDVSYDKALSRRLLNENVVLRREAEMKAKFPTKILLADLEPFLIDIANLPDYARPEDVREIKERVQKTEIVAALVDYKDRGTNNR
jgi:Putative zinc-finger